MIPVRLASVALLVAVAVATAILANVAWQNVYCGIPVCQASLFSPVPCEPVDKVLAEWKDLEQKARDHPAK